MGRHRNPDGRFALPGAQRPGIPALRGGNALRRTPYLDRRGGGGLIAISALAYNMPEHVVGWQINSASSDLVCLRVAFEVQVTSSGAASHCSVRCSKRRAQWPDSTLNTFQCIRDVASDHQSRNYAIQQ